MNPTTITLKNGRQVYEVQIDNEARQASVNGVVVAEGWHQYQPKSPSNGWVVWHPISGEWRLFQDLNELGWKLVRLYRAKVQQEPA